MSGLKEFYLRYPNRSWLLIICVVFLSIFGRGLWFPAEIMDDVLYINLNRKLDFTWANVVYWWKTPILDLHSPLQMYSYMLDRLIWGEQYFVFGCHLQNYLWHLIAVFSLFMIGRELGMRSAFAGVSALIFAIHPQRIESTVWLSERKDVLVLAFAMLSIWIFLRNLNNKFRMMQIIPPLLMLASLLSKPMAILLPLIILAILWYIRRNWDWRYYLRHLWPFLLVGLIYMAVKSTMVENYAKIAISGAEPMSIRLAIIANNFGNYFFKTIYPYVGMHLTQLFWKMAQYMGIATIMLSQYAVSGCVKCIPHISLFAFPGLSFLQSAIGHVMAGDCVRIGSGRLFRIFSGT
ncbi:MAG: hypothetical protein PHV75_04360 [Victivallaceae bacterium]|nr:hypothetical protein [Victivallaceae bacterium]